MLAILRREWNRRGEKMTKKRIINGSEESLSIINRRAIIRIMTGKGPMTTKEIVSQVVRTSVIEGWEDKLITTQSLLREMSKEWDGEDRAKYTEKFGGRLEATEDGFVFLQDGEKAQERELTDREMLQEILSIVRRLPRQVFPLPYPQPDPIDLSKGPTCLDLD